jgi:hypothetical protein
MALWTRLPSTSRGAANDGLWTTWQHSRVLLLEAGFNAAVPSAQIQLQSQNLVETAICSYITCNLTQRVPKSGCNPCCSSWAQASRWPGTSIPCVYVPNA